MLGGFLRLPVAHRPSGLLDVRAELPAEVTHQRTRVGAHLGAPEQSAKLRVGGLEQVLANVGHEVLVAGQHGNG